jgi:hypothetical protein
MPQAQTNRTIRNMSSIAPTARASVSRISRTIVVFSLLSAGRTPVGVV